MQEDEIDHVSQMEKLLHLATQHLEVSTNCLISCHLREDKVVRDNQKLIADVELFLIHFDMDKRRDGE